MKLLSLLKIGVLYVETHWSLAYDFSSEFQHKCRKNTLSKSAFITFIRLQSKHKTVQRKCNKANFSTQ
jgi:hypothetical protein